MGDRDRLERLIGIAGMLRLGGVPFVFTNVGMQMLQQPASSGAPQRA